MKMKAGQSIPQSCRESSSQDSGSLKDHFLIAMPGLSQSIFANSLTYICEHNEQGAMGIVINQPLELSTNEIFQHLQIKDICTSYSVHVMAGGPVEMNRGFVLHKPEIMTSDSASEKTNSAQPNATQQWACTVELAPDICLTTSLDILNAIAHNQGPKHNLIALGYAGWAGGQLEDEIAANAWLTIPADSHIIFDVPCEQRVMAATNQLGVSDLSLIAPTAGHA